MTTTTTNIHSQDPWFVDCIKPTMTWRNEAKSTGEHVFRAVACGVALAGIGIGALIDAIASLALAILTSPSLIIGSSLSTKLFNRTFEGLLTSGFALTFGEYKNLFPDKPGKKVI